MTLALDELDAAKRTRAGLRTLIFVVVAVVTAYAEAWVVSRGIDWLSPYQYGLDGDVALALEATRTALPALLGGVAAWLLPRPLLRTQPRPSSRERPAAWAWILAWVLTVAMVLLVWDRDAAAIPGAALEPESLLTSALRLVPLALLLALAAQPLMAAWRHVPAAAGGFVTALALGFAVGAGVATHHAPDFFVKPFSQSDADGLGVLAWPQWDLLGLDTAWTAGVTVALLAWGLTVAVNARHAVVRVLVCAAFFAVVLAPLLGGGVTYLAVEADFNPAQASEWNSLAFNAPPAWWEPGQLWSNYGVPAAACLALFLTVLSGPPRPESSVDLDFLEGQGPAGPGRFGDAAERGSQEPPFPPAEESR